jgi:hypothetical protein
LEDIGMGAKAHGGMAGMDHGKMDGGNNPSRHDPRIPGPNGPTPFKPDKGNTNVAMVIMNTKYRLDEPGLGLDEDGWRVLTYGDLVSTEPQPSGSGYQNSHSRVKSRHHGGRWITQSQPHSFHHDRDDKGNEPGRSA